jgi:glutamyl-Q tRNA(Asp) synthetase
MGERSRPQYNRPAWQDPRSPALRRAPALHLGHAYAAVAHQATREPGALSRRMENRTRPLRVPGWRRPSGDLAWLGLAGPARRQSEYLPYRAALDTVSQESSTCFCPGRYRREIGPWPPLLGPDGPWPPAPAAICRRERQARLAAGPRPPGWLWLRSRAARRPRLASRRRALPPKPADRGQPALLGDIVLGRKDTGVGYHLAVVVDDADQGITLVHGALTSLRRPTATASPGAAGASDPRYRHHALIRDARAAPRQATRPDRRRAS